MTPSEYVPLALRTESPITPELTDRAKAALRLLHGAMGLETEVGEFQDALKKHIFYGKPLDKVNLKEEIGDLFWYIALISDALGFSWEEVMQQNIAKLRLRYPAKFNEVLALERDLEAERKVLETPILDEFWPFNNKDEKEAFEEKERLRDTVICPACSGEGCSEAAQFHDPQNRCDGSGRIPKERKKATQKIPEGEACCDICGHNMPQSELAGYNKDRKAVCQVCHKNLPHVLLFQLSDF